MYHIPIYIVLLLHSGDLVLAHMMFMCCSISGFCIVLSLCL